MPGIYDILDFVKDKDEDYMVDFVDAGAGTGGIPAASLLRRGG